MNWLLLLTGGNVYQIRKRPSKAVIFEFERARGVFRSLTLHSVACIAFEFGKFETEMPGLTILNFVA